MFFSFDDIGRFFAPKCLWKVLKIQFEVYWVNSSSNVFSLWRQHKFIAAPASRETSLFTQIFKSIFNIFCSRCRWVPHYKPMFIHFCTCPCSWILLSTFRSIFHVLNALLDSRMFWNDISNPSDVNLSKWCEFWTLI